MSDADSQPIQKWTWMRWLVLITIVFVAHVALIFIFGARKQVVPLRVENIPSLTLAGGSSSDWLSLNDATLFALPNANGFAGPLWVAFPPKTFTRQDWTEKPRWLALAATELGIGFNEFVQTNSSAGLHFEYNLSPPLTMLALAMQPSFETNSTLQIEGEVAKRPLLGAMNLPSWPSADVIPPSIVQVLVDAAGNVISAVLLPPENYFESSDYTTRDNSDADRYAVAVARVARFTPLASDAMGIESNPSSRLAIGRLIFNWQTVPVTVTNNPE